MARAAKGERLLKEHRSRFAWTGPNPELIQREVVVLDEEIGSDRLECKVFRDDTKAPMFKSFVTVMNAGKKNRER